MPEETGVMDRERDALHDVLAAEQIPEVGEPARAESNRRAPAPVEPEKLDADVDRQQAGSILPQAPEERLECLDPHPGHAKVGEIPLARGAHLEHAARTEDD